MPTLDEFLKRGSSKIKEKRFYLNDQFDFDPRLYCPECSSNNLVNKTPRHTADYAVFYCNKCYLTYELDYEPIGH